VAGTLLARRADVIADVTGLGEALIGAVLLGGSTSLPGVITSVATAWEGYPALSISNAVGGITVQTAFLAVADMFYRRANLEHAAASAANLTQGALLVSLLAVPVLALSGPEWTLFGIHPATVLMIGGYGYGVHLINIARQTPMWAPRVTGETQQEGEEKAAAAKRDGSNARLAAEFAGLAAITAGAGYGVSQFGIALSRQTGLSETTVGGLFTAISTSLPELVTSIAAVRAGALNLAVGGVIGGNAFDTLFLAFADIAYRDGSLYHQFNSQHVFVVALAILMTGTLLLGMLRREASGFAGIGFESVSILALYAAGVAILLG
jgi:cation:H+ antiporter